MQQDSARLPECPPLHPLGHLAWPGRIAPHASQQAQLSFKEHSSCCSMQGPGLLPTWWALCCNLQLSACPPGCDVQPRPLSTPLHIPLC